MSSKADIFTERGKLLERKKRDLFEERAALMAPEKEPSALKEIPTQLLKGGAKGFLGAPGDIAEALGVREFASRYAGLPPGYDIPTGEEVGKFIERFGGPGEPETAPGRYSARIGESVGGALPFGISAPVAGALAGGAALGQTAEEAGFSPQTAALVELLGAVGSGAISKKLLPSSKVGKEVVEAGRKLGLTEQQIAPLAKGEGAFEIARKVARKNIKLPKIAGQIETKLGDSYTAVKEAAKKSGNLSLKQRRGLVESLEKKLKDLSVSHAPSADKQKATKVIDKTLKSLRNKVPSYESLIESYQDINKDSRGVRNILKSVKEDYTKVLGQKSPELAKDFAKTNKLYSRFRDRLGKLKPAQSDAFWDKVEILGVGEGIIAGMMGNPAYMIAGMAPFAGRTLANQFLTNPYLQNLPNKFLKSVMSGKKKNTIALVNSFKKYMKKNYDLDEEELESVASPKEK